MAAEKTCRACGETKEADEFCRDTRSPDGLQSRCKACYQIYFSLWSAQKKAQRATRPAGEAAAPLGTRSAPPAAWRRRWRWGSQVNVLAVFARPACTRAARADTFFCNMCVQDFKVSRSKTTDDGRAGSCMECSKRKVKTPKEPRPPAAEKRKRAS